MLTPEQSLRSLKDRAWALGSEVCAVAAVVLDDPKFAACSGCAHNGKADKPQKHHYDTGGLVRHTWEVVNLCEVNRAFYETRMEKQIDEKALFLAALFHDVGKTFDYEWDHGPDPSIWKSTPHRRNIHHISRSGLIWHDAVKSTGFFKEVHDEVYHAILSHHGLREWGSPVMPNTPIAWLLHLCDNMSARMDETGKFDALNYVK